MSSAESFWRFNMKFIKAGFFLAATAVMALCLLFVPESSGSVSISYTSVVGVYLGLDIAAMIARTSKLQKGSFEPMNVYKYVLVSACLAVLIVTAVIVRGQSDVSTAMTSFITSAMIVIGCVIGGLEGNKIATDLNGNGIPDYLESGAEETEK